MDLREPLIEATRKLQVLRAKLDAAEARDTEPLAIVAMSCRLPGGVTSPEALWSLLDRGGDAMEPFPAERWNADELYDPDPDVPGKTTCTVGGFVHGIDGFDAGFFGIAPREAEGMDPAQRLALECAWEVLERAGAAPRSFEGSRTGVFLGGVHTDYEPWGGRRGMVGMDGYEFTGRDGSVLSGRVSYTLGLRGPAVTVNTACSSSLVALHLASRALRSGECDFAICGGSQVMTTPGCFVEFSRLRGLAHDGRCKSFSDQADGVGWAEGCTMLLLQRLSDAQAHGRRIWAVIRGSAINQDGRSQGLTAPSGPAQQEVIRTALASCGLSPSDVDAVEAHGTGTALGDPIEAGALAATYGKAARAEPLYVGSCKSNIGHTQAASGVAGVMKMALALAHGRLPASLHADTPTRHIDWERSGLRLVSTAQSWPRGERPRRAGVNSFGISGTNAHVILEEAPAVEAMVAAAPRVDGAVPLVLSGSDAPALRAQAAQLAAHVDAHQLAAADVARALATTRTHLAARVALSVSASASSAVLADQLRAVAEDRLPEGATRGTVETRPGKLAMLFSGQGSQRARMGLDLAAQHPAFAEALETVLAGFDPLVPELRAILAAPEDSEEAARLNETQFTQPALFAVEVALFRLWQAWGVQPDVVLGHSIGELAAAYVAGVWSLEDACTLVAHRGRLMQACPGGGAMFAIGAPYAAVAEQLLGLEDRLSVAAVNTEHQTVISGDLPSGMAIATLLRSMGHRVRKLKVSHAFHSPHMNGMLEAYREVAEGLTYHPPTLPVVSCLTGTVASPELLCTADYWVRQVRGAVRFHKGMTAALAEGAERFVECGPHAVLAPMAAEVVAPDMPCIPSLVKGREESVALMEAVGALHTTGAELDWDAVFGDLGGTVVPLPTYAFQRSRYWLEGAGTDDRPLDRAGVEGVRHPILGAEISLPGGGVLFTGRLRPSALPWVADHDVHGQALLPAMAWLDLAMMAGDRVDVGEVSELVFETPLRLGTDPVDIQILLGPDEDGRRTVEGYARRVGDWVRHASGRLTAAGAVQRGRAGRVPEEAETLDLSSMYPFLSGLGLSYGPAFQGLRETRRHGLDLFARVALPEAVTTGGFHAHPALLDAGLHAILAAAGDITQISVPVELESARRGPGRLGREAVVQVRLPDDRPGLPSEASMAFFTPNGELALELDRVLFRGISAKDLVSGGATRRGDLFRMDWTPATLEGGRPRRAACAVVGDGALSHEVAAALRGEGVRVLRLDRLAQVEAGIASYDGEIHGVVLVVGSAGDPRSTTTAALAELQAWTRQLRDERLVIVTSEAVATEAAARCDLDVAGVGGLYRAVRNEHPDHAWRWVDTDLDDRSLRGLADVVFASGLPELALRDGALLQPQLVRDVGAASPWTPDGTVLITGGTRGLGASVARHVAPHASRVVLVSRRGPDTPGVGALVSELESLGTPAEAVACDVADAEAVRALLLRYDELAAVFHAAGVLDDGLTQSVTPDGVARVFAPKVDGALALHAALPDRARLVLFSSIAGLVGNEGQLAYSAANALLDALAATRRAAGQDALSLAWGPWSEIGMASRLPESAVARMRRSGFEMIAPDEGLRLLDAALGADASVLAPLCLSRDAHGDHALGRLLQPHRDKEAVVEVVAPAPKATFRARLDAATDAERDRMLLEMVKSEAASVLRLSDASAISEDRPLDTLGMDSLMAVDIRRRIENRLDTRLPPTVVFDYPSSKLLVSYLTQMWSAGGEA